MIMGEKRAVLCPRRRQVPLLVVTTLLVGVRTELVGEYEAMRDSVREMRCVSTVHFMRSSHPPCRRSSIVDPRSSQSYLPPGGVVARVPGDHADDTCSAPETVNYVAR